MVSRPDLFRRERSAFWALALTCAVTCAATPRESTATPLFGPHMDFRTGSGPYGLASGDFNNDSIPDLAVADYGPYDGDSVSILLGNGDGTFQPHIRLRTPRAPLRVATGDLNGDHHDDLIVLNSEYSPPLSIFLGHGDATFEERIDVVDEVPGVKQFALSDMNGDNHLDVLTTYSYYDAADNNTLKHKIAIWLGTGDGHMNTPLRRDVISSGAIAIGDVNSDNRPDVVASNLYNASVLGEPPVVFVMTGNGDGTLNDPVTYSVPDSPSEIDLGDVNGDTYLDAVTANSRSNTVSVLLGDGYGNFVAQTPLPAAGEADAIQIADIDGDGRMDIATTVFAALGKVSVFLGMGDGAFPTRRDFDALTFTFDVIARDLNRDGRIDLAVTNVLSNAVSILVNTGCGGSLESITGVFPNRGGDGGEVTVSIYGCSFQPGATARLTRGGGIIEGNPVNVSAEGVVTANFDLTGQSLGAWDVEVWAPGGPNPARRLNGFTIEPNRPPLVWVDVYQRTRFRTGRLFQSKVAGGNSGNNNFKGFAAVCIDNQACAQGDALKFKTFEVDPFPPGSSGVFTLPWNIPAGLSIEQFYNIEGLAGSGSIGGCEVSGHVSATLFQAQIPPPNSQGEVSPGAAVVAQQMTKTHGHGILYKYWERIGRGDCLMDLDSNFEKDLQAEVSLQLFSLVNEFTADPLNHSDLARSDVLILRAVDEALKVVSDSPPGSVSLYRSCFDTIDRTAFRSSLCDLLKSLALEKDKLAAVTPNWMRDTTVTVTCAAGDGCDPNEKVGATGLAAGGYIVGNRPLTYTVFFENDPQTTTFSAAEVSITDQLDPTKVDLGTVSLGSITFGDHSVTPIPGMNPWVGEVDLRPDQNLKVRIIAQLDAVTGLLTFRFQSLDPVTGLDPEEQTLGFLPPNVTPPEGEGSVSFSVMPRADISSGTLIHNLANIVFDTRPAMQTNEVSNVIDTSKPMSQVVALELVPGQETSIVAQWSGSDVGSGISKFLIYASDNGGPYSLWRVSTAQQDTFPGQDGHLYGFYSVARDLVGNEEDPPQAPDDTISIGTVTGVESGAKPELALRAVTPNPTWDNLRVSFSLADAERATIEVFNVSGRRVAAREVGNLGPGSHILTLGERKRLPSGVYIVRLTQGERRLTTRAVLVR